MKKKEKWVCKPGSVRLTNCFAKRDNHSSGLDITANLKQPTRKPLRAAKCFKQA